MSLINEALKRAQRTQQQGPPAPPSGPPLRPVEAGPRGRQGPSALLVLALVLVVACAAILILQWRQMLGQRQRPSDVAVQPTAFPPAASAPTAGDTEWSERTRELPEPPPTANPATAVGQPAQDLSRSAAQSNVVSAAPAVPAAPEAVARETQPPAAPRESFRLQGILYSPAGSVAVINGKSVRAGDRVGTGRVLAITRESVMLAVGSQTNVLTLE